MPWNFHNILFRYYLHYTEYGDKYSVMFVNLFKKKIRYLSCRYF